MQWHVAAAAVVVALVAVVVPLVVVVVAAVEILTYQANKQKEGITPNSH